MPIYEYRCDSCRRHFEARQPVLLRDAARCECGIRAERVFTPTSQILIPAAFGLPMDWAGTGGEGQSLSGRSQIKKPRTETLKQAFDKVKQWE
jgi:putative FmdB family regulatory protein